jgi:hypothetical protein
MEDNIDDWEEKRKGYLTVAVICFIVGTFPFMKVKSDSYAIKPAELKVIENLITANKPKFQETKGKHSRQWIEFKCVNNKSTFKIADFDYKCVNDDEILNEINVGDTISINILKNELEDFDTDASCEIHSLVKNKKEYLDINCRNDTENKEAKGIYTILFAITTMTAFVYSFTQKPKIFDDVDPRFPIWIVIIALFFILR